MVNNNFIRVLLTPRSPAAEVKWQFTNRPTTVPFLDELNTQAYSYMPLFITRHCLKRGLSVIWQQVKQWRTVYICYLSQTGEEMTLIMHLFIVAFVTRLFTTGYLNKGKCFSTIKHEDRWSCYSKTLSRNKNTVWISLMLFDDVQTSDPKKQAQRVLRWPGLWRTIHRNFNPPRTALLSAVLVMFLAIEQLNMLPLFSSGTDAGPTMAGKEVMAPTEPSFTFHFV